MLKIPLKIEISKNSVAKKNTKNIKKEGKSFIFLTVAVIFFNKHLIK